MIIDPVKVNGVDVRGNVDATRLLGVVSSQLSDWLQQHACKHAECCESCDRPIEPQLTAPLFILQRKTIASKRIKETNKNKTNLCMAWLLCNMILHRHLLMILLIIIVVVLIISFSVL